MRAAEQGLGNGKGGRPRSLVGALGQQVCVVHHHYHAGAQREGVSWAVESRRMGRRWLSSGETMGLVGGELSRPWWGRPHWTRAEQEAVRIGIEWLRESSQARPGQWQGRPGKDSSRGSWAREWASCVRVKK